MRIMNYWWKIVKIEQNDEKMRKNDQHLTKIVNNWWETVYKWWNIVSYWQNVVKWSTFPSKPIFLVTLSKIVRFLGDFWLNELWQNMILWWSDTYNIDIFTLTLTNNARKPCFKGLHCQKLLPYQNDVAFKKNQRPLLEHHKGYSQKLKVTSNDHN